jgi:hypothetical protein
MFQKHIKEQRRKRQGSFSYIFHPIAVAKIGRFQEIGLVRLRLPLHYYMMSWKTPNR